MHILLIEDTVRLAKLLELELSDAGYQVSVANDGMSGLQKALSIQPDLILLDWMLPRLTGIEVCAQLRLSRNTMPIIFLTSMSDPDKRALAFATGANDYLLKPFDFNELRLAIENQLTSAVGSPMGNVGTCLS